MQIFHALGTIVGGLGGGIAGPLEDISRGKICRTGQQIREQLGLVEAALALPGRMQWHRNDEIEAAAAETRIVQGFAQPVGHGMPKMALSRVLELMDQPANQTAAPVGGDGAVEVEDAMLAIGATEGLGNR